MKYRCIKPFSVPKFDDAGYETGEGFTVEKGSIWKLSESGSSIIGGEIHLDSNKYGWLEISNKDLAECFKPVQEANHV